MNSVREEFPVTCEFEQQARNICNQAETRGEPVYGISPWYCAAGQIEHGARVAFIGANPGGGARSQQDDDRIGRLRRPYEDPRYNAWLDDRHWEGGGGSHQQRVLDAFRLLFGDSEGEGELRKAACLNVVPVRSVSTADLSSETWSSGVEWFTRVLRHVSPELVVCNGNGRSRSPWSALDSVGSGITAVELRAVYNTFNLKRGRIADGDLTETIVIGLPHLGRMRSIVRLRGASSGWTFAG